MSSTMHTPAATTTHMPAATTTHVPVATTTTHTTHVAHGMPGHQVRAWRACRAPQAAAAERAALCSKHVDAVNDLFLTLYTTASAPLHGKKCVPLSSVWQVCGKSD